MQQWKILLLVPHNHYIFLTQLHSFILEGIMTQILCQTTQKFFFKKSSNLTIFFMSLQVFHTRACVFPI